MTRDYISTEVEKIVKDNTLSSPLNFVMASAWLMGNFKGINLKALDLKKTATIADYFVIGSATNPTQMTAMAEEIAHQMRQFGVEAISREGLKHSTDWILLDYGDFIVHVFSEAARTVYDLDHLYKNAESIEIPQSYYFSSPDDSTIQPASDKSYF